jgi:alcohol dehydrogenase (cytochrome c)
MAFRGARSVVTAAVVASLVGGCGGHGKHATWTLSSGDLAGTRSVSGSRITSDNVAALRVRWRFSFTAKPSFAGVFSSTPVVDQDTVYVQDLRSNVFALNRSTGAVRWTQQFRARTGGPNGLAVDGGRVYGATDADAFALSASNGRELWRVHLVNRREPFVDIAPVTWNGLVLLSTVGSAPLGHGAIYALDAATGAVRWKFVTVVRRRSHLLGGGLRYPVSVDALGRVYAGNSNGGAAPGGAPYTDSLLVLDAATGRLLWHDRVTPHDVRDYGFEATPILATLRRGNIVFGAGKAGRVIAWNRDTRRRLWDTAVGLHRNDAGPLPLHRVTVCPGLLGGVATPMAYSDGRLFVPVVDLCGWSSAVSRQPLADVHIAIGTGRLVALDANTGHTLWLRRLPSPNFGCATVSNDVVFTATLDGTVYAFAARDGRLLWHARMRAGVNACPAVVDDTLLVGSGIRRPGGAMPELVAFALPS